MLLYHDSIEVQWTESGVTFTQKFDFPELWACDAMEVASVLNKLLAGTAEPKLVFRQEGPIVSMSLEEGTTRYDFQITGISHRLQLITGLYDMTLPLDSKIATYPVITALSAPYIYYGNKLYLTSDQGNVIKSCNIQSPTVILRINEFMMSTLPILIKPRKEDRDVVIADGTNFHEISVQLVDRWYHPVSLRSPMIVTIKMKPVLLDTVAFGWN
jgi:hypothetical protein